MNEDYLHLDLPVFKPSYKNDTKYSYSNDMEKAQLKQLLCDTTHGYCMYCYTRILIDGDINADIEHGVEKSLSDKLEDCLPNLGLSCKKCNQSYKRKGELKRGNIPKDILSVLEEFNVEKCKSPALCREGCDGYKNLRKCYSEYRNIILQPMMVPDCKSIIQYDVLKRIFIPSPNIDEDVRTLVQAHIDRFCMNDPKRRTKELVRFCKDVVDGSVKPVKGRYNNMIVDLFIDKIGDMQEKKYKAICSVILSQSIYKRDIIK